MAVGKSPLQIWFEGIPAPFRNRYFLVLVAFFGWMVFFDKHDFITQWQLKRSVDKLEQDKAYYSRKIEKAEKEFQDLQDNREKFAREKYYLQRSNEDVFIIKKESELEK